MAPTEILTFLGLAVVGIDPFGGLIAAGALAHGARTRALLSLTGAYLALIVVEILVLHPVLLFAGHLLGPLLSRPGFWSIAQLLVGVALAAVAVQQGLSARKPPSAPKARGVSVRAMAIAGALLAITSLADPPFVLSVGLASQVGSLPERIALLVAWNLLYQGPLFVLLILALTPLRERAVAAYQSALTRWRTAIVRTLVALLSVAAVAAILEAVHALATGRQPWLHVLLT